MSANNSESKGEIITPTEHHLSKMADIFQSGQAPHCASHPEIFCEANNRDEIINYIRGYFEPRNLLRRRGRRKFARVWVVDGEVGGYLLYQLHQTSDVFFGDKRWTCYVDDIAIDPNFQKAGGASQLMDALMEEVSGLKNCLVSGQVWRDNVASEALFRKYGFDDRSKTFFRVMD